MEYGFIESILQTYDFDEILEFNELTQEEVLQFLVDEEFLKLPDIRPL